MPGVFITPGVHYFSIVAINFTPIVLAVLSNLIVVLTLVVLLCLVTTLALAIILALHPARTGMGSIVGVPGMAGIVIAAGISALRGNVATRNSRRRTNWIPETSGDGGHIATGIDRDSESAIHSLADSGNSGCCPSQNPRVSAWSMSP